MGNIKVSVILPSLNVHEFIEECLESAVNQTLKEIEIICVDAGSTDGTLEIIKNYAAKDNRIKVLVSDKKSYGYQMNLGIDNATGEYIGILETDDVASLNMYEDLYTTAVANDVDFVKADFYRFTGRGDSLSKAYYKLTWYSSAYNKIVDIRHNQEPFTYCMNTWSGIYKRQFLIDNNIRHNETPGASFQDNGFWFQTFMYARRAYFVNKPYYMNRRDNAGSSVYSKSKVYCICDEYDFLFTILQKNQELMDDFGFSFTYACLQAYKANLDRIGDEYRLDFLRKWSDDFRKYRDLGLLDYRKINGTDWQNLLKIMDDPDKYYEDAILREKLFLEEVRRNKSIIIYGAGMIGKRIWEKLRYCETPADVISFAVTKKEENYSNYKGTPIKCIDELLDYRETGCVVIGTTELYQDDIRRKLNEYSFEHIISAPYKQEKDDKYYKNLDLKGQKKEISEWYRLTTGKKMDFDNVISINEKIQYSKLFGRSVIKEQVSDKLELRDFIAREAGERYLPELIGIYEKAGDIPFDKLPSEFIIKLSNSDYMLWVRNKSDDEYYNWDVLSRRLDIGIRTNNAFVQSLRLWHKNDRGKIIIESLAEGQSLYDYYKFICVEGKVKYITVERDKWRFDASRRDFFDTEWNHLEIKMKYPNAEVEPEKPDKLAEMISVSEELASEFGFAVIHIMDTKAGIIVNDIRFQIGYGVEYVEGNL